MSFFLFDALTISLKDALTFISGIIEQIRMVTVLFWLKSRGPFFPIILTEDQRSAHSGCIWILTKRATKESKHKSIWKAAVHCFLVALLLSVFLSGLLDYSSIPQDVILKSAWPEGLRIWKHQRSWTGSGLCGECHQRVGDFPWEGSSQSAVHTLRCLSLSGACVSFSI